MSEQRPNFLKRLTPVGPRTLARMAKVRGKTKIFIIGRNKTGTSTVAAALAERGGIVSSKPAGERLLDTWAIRDFDPVLKLCRRAEVFADVPFGLPYTYQIVDQAFPGSKFVLTEWSDSRGWYDAFTGYHARKFGDGDIPSAEALQTIDYRRPGFVADVLRLGYRASLTNPYEKSWLIEQYERHNAEVRDYFVSRPDDLLVVDIANPESLDQLFRFTGFDRSNGSPARTAEFVIGDPTVSFHETADSATIQGSDS